MGTSPRLLLRFPELNDPANVPTDMRELTDDIEGAVGGFLPQPVFRQQVDPPQNVAALSPAWTNLNPQASLSNPHPKLFLLVILQLGVWSSTKGNVSYFNLFTSGHAGVAMIDGSRVEDTYTSTSLGGMATIAPAGAITVRAQGRRLTNTSMPTAPSVRVGIVPVGWLKAGTIG